MNTLRAFQGTDTAFDVTLNPSSVDFADTPDLVATVHRGDGGAVAVLTPTWTSTINDAVSVPMPGTVTAGLEPGHYFLTVATADGSAVLSHDTLVIWTMSGPSLIRSLVSPSELVGVIPEVQSDLAQLDAVPWLLEAATVACESYCDMTLALADVDRLVYVRVRDTITLVGRPVYDFRAWANPDADTWGDILQYTEAMDDWADYGLDEARGEVCFWHGDRTIYVGRHTPRRVRLTYRAGYATDPADVDLGVAPVPKDLRSACVMVAVAIRESAKTAGPTQQQGVTGTGGGYYTKNINETAVPAPARALLDRYSRQWGVA